MNLPQDLKNYRAPDAFIIVDRSIDDLGAFQKLTGDECVICICLLAVYAGIFWPYL